MGSQSVVDHIAVQKLVDAALARFDRDGYDGTSIRDLVADAGLSTSVFYQHFPSKHSILVEIIDAAHAAALAEMEGAVAIAGDDPARRLEAAVWSQCDFQIRCQPSCRVAATELHRLDPDDRERVLRTQIKLCQVLSEIISDGASCGAFDASEPETTSQAVSNLCGSIGSWYDPSGHEVPREIAEAYCKLAARMAGVRLYGARRLRRLAMVPVRQSA